MEINLYFNAYYLRQSPFYTYLSTVYKVIHDKPQYMITYDLVKQARNATPGQGNVMTQLHCDSFLSRFF